MRYCRQRTGLSLTLTAFLALSVWLSSPAQELLWIASNQAGISDAWGVSDDGRIVVGRLGNRAYRWTAPNTLELLPLLGGYFGSRAFEVSPDGRIIVGLATDTMTSSPAIWVDNNYPILLSVSGTAFDASTTGHVAGSYYSSTDRAFLRYPNGAFLDLGSLGGVFADARALATPNNDPVVVGRSTTGSNVRAFRWQRTTGMVDLGALGGGHSAAYDVSRDGRIIVGASWASSSPRTAVRWSPRGAGWTISNLGIPAGANWAEALACNADGNIVVGWGDGSNGHQAFRWTLANGMENLNQTYASLLTNGSRLLAAYDISADGCYIVGEGHNAATGRQEAFLLVTCCFNHNGDVNRDDCVDDADLLQILFNFGQTGSNLGRVDVNCDGVVDDADLLVVLFNFGVGC